MTAIDSPARTRPGQLPVSHTGRVRAGRVPCQHTTGGGRMTRNERAFVIFLAILGAAIIVALATSTRIARGGAA